MREPTMLEKKNSRKQRSLPADGCDNNGPQSNHPGPYVLSASAKEDAGGFVLVILEEKDSRSADLAFFTATWPALAEGKI